MSTTATAPDPDDSNDLRELARGVFGKQREPLEDLLEAMNKTTTDTTEETSA